MSAPAPLDLAAPEFAPTAAVLIGVRKVAFDLQAALDHFRNDARLRDLTERQVPDARQRLTHVLKLTDEAAHRTMDLVEQSCPLVDAVGNEAARLVSLPNLALAVTQHLETTTGHMKLVRGKLTDVLLTQGYQDLSGQIIRSVIKLVEELELALNSLIKIGDLGSPPESLALPTSTATSSHGPVVPGVAHGNTVGDQMDVDAMLSGLGM